MAIAVAGTWASILNSRARGIGFTVDKVLLATSARYIIARGSFFNGK